MQKVILIIAVTIMTLSLKAQFSVGVRQGYGSYGIYLEKANVDLEKYQVPLYKYNTGIVIAYNNINNVGLQAEINYAQKGWQEQDSVPDSYFKRNINYLEIPIYSHWEIGYGKIRPIIFAGPYLAWKLSESTDSANFSRIWHEGSSYPQYDQEIKKMAFGIKIGLGLKYNITSRFAIFIDGRYDFQMAGGRDIFIDRPDGIQASRLKEISGTFGIIWHIIRQPEKKVEEGYTPKENLYD